MVLLRSLLALSLSLSVAKAADVPRGTPWPRAKPYLTPARLTCKAASSCEEAVILWCDGYYGADRDHDGIPCENVCSSREEVEAIEAQIGCDL